MFQESLRITENRMQSFNLLRIDWVPIVDLTGLISPIDPIDPPERNSNCLTLNLKFAHIACTVLSSTTNPCGNVVQRPYSGQRISYLYNVYKYLLDMAYIV
jgi:hypothetical protein